MSFQLAYEDTAGRVWNVHPDARDVEDVIASVSRWLRDGATWVEIQENAEDED